MNLTVALKIFAYLVANKDLIKQMVLAIQALIPDAPGATKAAAIKEAIGKALSLEQQVEDGWGLVGPVFNAFVASIKAEK